MRSDLAGLCNLALQWLGFLLPESLLPNLSLHSRPPVLHSPTG